MLFGFRRVQERARSRNNGLIRFDRVGFKGRRLPALAGGAEDVPGHFQAGGVMVAAAQDGDVAHEGGEVFELGERGCLRITVPIGKDENNADGEEAGGVVGHQAAGGFDFFGSFGNAAESIEEVMAGLPLGITAQPPFRKVLGADGFSVEEIQDDLLDFREGVEPLDEGAAGDAALEAAVEFVAERAGETGDFSSAGHESVVWLFNHTTGI